MSQQLSYVQGRINSLQGKKEFVSYLITFSITGVVITLPFLKKPMIRPYNLAFVSTTLATLYSDYHYYHFIEAYTRSEAKLGEINKFKSAVRIRENMPYSERYRSELELGEYRILLCDTDTSEVDEKAFQLM